MQDENVLPLPQLSTTTEVLNLGPVIDPPFSDARSWREFLTPIEIKPVYFEQLEPTLTKDRARQATELALASERLRRDLEGKRYEIMGVGMRSLDRRTEYPLVVIYNYTNDIVLEAMVDLTGRTVLEVKTERYQPPLAAVELSRALDLLSQDGRLHRRGIDVNTGTGIVVEEENFRSPRHGHRLVDLRFGPEDRRLPTAWAIVDLTSQEVVKTGIFPQEEPL
jgi:hypothetical protein